MISEDTICAIATAQGGAIGVIRVSGPEAINITDQVFRSAGKPLAERNAYTIAYGQIVDEGVGEKIAPDVAIHDRSETVSEGKCVLDEDIRNVSGIGMDGEKVPGGEVIDEVLVNIFRAPHSFTGENSVEIMCHGSSYILQRVMQLLIQHGCRSAQPGEYTQRSFLNGKMDLSQAEAIADLIASTNASSHRLAMSQMRGGFSAELAKLRSMLLDFTSLIELELDFSEEDVEFADRQKLKELAAQMETFIVRLVDSFSVGNAVKNGIPVAIIGDTNAGKSTLLNLLVNDDRSIVSDIHGTTRDIIEDTVNLRGITFRFIDTAGIRDTQDTIETLGIERTFKKLDQASIVLWVIDATTTASQSRALLAKIRPHCEGKKLVLLFNKTDLIDDAQRESLTAFADESFVIKDDRGVLTSAERLFISAKRKENIAALEEVLLKAAALPEINPNDVIVTNVRHYEALVHVLDCIHRIQEGLENNLPGDLLSQDIRECIHYLSDILGEITTDEVLGSIFSRFCVGK